MTPTTEVYLRHDLYRLGVAACNQTLLNQEKAGRFPARFHIGRSARWPARAVDQWIAAHVSA